MLVTCRCLLRMLLQIIWAVDNLCAATGAQKRKGIRQQDLQIKCDDVYACARAASGMLPARKPFP